MKVLPANGYLKGDVYLESEEQIMSENPVQDQPNTNEYFSDHLNVRHSDGRSEKISLPTEEGGTIRIGRELDNDVVLSDARGITPPSGVPAMGWSLKI